MLFRPSRPFAELLHPQLTYCRWLLEPPRQDSRLCRCVEDLLVQGLIPKLSVERFDASVLPWSTRGGERRRDTHPRGDSRPGVAADSDPLSERRWIGRPRSRRPPSAAPSPYHPWSVGQHISRGTRVYTCRSVSGSRGAVRHTPGPS